MNDMLDQEDVFIAKELVISLMKLRLAHLNDWVAFDKLSSFEPIQILTDYVKVHVNEN